MPDSSSARTSAVVTTALCAVGGACAMLLWKARNNQHGENKKCSLTPLCPTGFFATAKILGGPTAPFFVLEQSRLLGTSCFRLGIPVGTGGFHVIGDPELTRQIFMDSTTTKPREVYKNFEGAGQRTIFTSGTDSYVKAVRKSVAHAFSKKEIERMNAIAVKHVRAWIQERLERFATTGETFDPCFEMTRLTFFIINEAAFEYQPTEEEFESFTDHLETMLREFTFKQSMSPWRKWFGFMIPEVRRARCCARAALSFANKVMEAYKANPNKSAQTTIIKLFSDAKYFSGESQRDSETLSFIVAGQDTTGFTLGNALTLLAKHPDEQRKVRDALLANKQRPACSAKDVPAFRNALQECMRLVPVGAMGSVRKTGRDIYWGDKVIPKGAVCSLNQFLCNRNPDVFQAPDEFRPERWANETDRMKESKMTFALGSRNCPGQYLATAEIHSLLPLILTQYSLELVDEGSFDYFLTLKFAGSKVRATRLSTASS